MSQVLHEKCNFDVTEKKVNKYGILHNLTFVVTGFLPTYSREEVYNMIKFNGGLVTNSVSKKTNYVIVGSHPGQKYQQAIKLNTPILSEQEFIELLQGNK